MILFCFYVFYLIVQYFLFYGCQILARLFSPGEELEGGIAGASYMGEARITFV